MSTVALPWPLFGLTDERGRDVGYTCVQGPARTAQESEVLSAVASSGKKLIGFTSYGCFPAERQQGDRFDYAGHCLAWCHCFREPDRFLPSGKPLLDISHSDFTDYSWVSPYRLYADDNGAKDFDFVYVCQSGQWAERAKNWDLARRCLPVLCRQMNLTGVLVGRSDIADLPDCDGRVKICGPVPWRQLMGFFLRSRFLFVPSELDASPRIIAEALCMNTPVVVNRHILGGWKYVNPFTGAFFESERDVAEAVRSCLGRWTSPRRWFIANHGPLLAGQRLRRFLAGLDPALSGIERLQITYTITLDRCLVRR